MHMNMNKKESTDGIKNMTEKTPKTEESPESVTTNPGLHGEPVRKNGTMTVSGSRTLTLVEQPAREISVTLTVELTDQGTGVEAPPLLTREDSRTCLSPSKPPPPHVLTFDIIRAAVKFKRNARLSSPVSHYPFYLVSGRLTVWQTCQHWRWREGRRGGRRGPLGIAWTYGQQLL